MLLGMLLKALESFFTEIFNLLVLNFFILMNGLLKENLAVAQS